ncbi:M56 family metallopeptidase [Pedobacter endophyticus]|uniref:TonB family protein n=1 Tax=Pedobacter endophyticus TaxID=2789740 RepID=A0A7U3Q346_9SPHI|nr:M56 family metallopeptidase [Pedobacter endophyticus]QPH37648.1 TonB family protein [Pedobacter endophyticus]
MSFAHYLLQVNLYLVVFYGFYKLLLDRETYFTLNRFYLIGAGVLSLCIPFIRLEWLTQQKAAQQVYTSINWEAVLQQATIVTETNTGLNWANVFVYLYCAGILFFLVRLVVNLFLVKKLIRNARSGSAFSFFFNKVVDKNLPQMNVINIHEEAHIKQLHSLDILFFELLGIITWLNPIIYLYKRSIKNIHEFLADEFAAEYQGDKAEYALLILSQSFGISPNALTNGFFDKSLIKKRIFMLQKERSKRIAVIKYGISIPLFAVLIVFSSATVRKSEKLISLTDQIPLDQSFEMVQQMVTEEANEEISPKEPPTFEKVVEVNLTPKSSQNTSPKPGEVNKLGKLIAQPLAQEKKPQPETVRIEESKVYDFVSLDKQPEFPGGIRKFYEYLSRSIRYPQAAQENNLQGKVFLSFIVEKSGDLSDIKITRGLGNGMDEEAVRVLTNSPKWIPGMSDGKTVRVKYNINVNFTLTDDSDEAPKAVQRPTSLKLTDGNFAGVVVVDGVRMTENSLLATIDPNSIKSIEVLKSQNAVSLYGFKAKAGAILITTKSGNIFRRPNTTEQALTKPSYFGLQQAY